MTAASFQIDGATRALPQHTTAIIASITICTLSGLLAVCLGMDRFWDFRNYHLYAPYAFLHERLLFDVAPGQRQGYLDPVPNFLPYVLLFSSLNNFPRLVVFLLGAIHGLNAVLLARIASQVLNFASSRVRIALTMAALTIGFSGAQVIGILGTTMTDLIVSIFALWSLSEALVATCNSRGLFLPAVLSGGLIGVAIGLKLTAIFHGPGVGLIFIILAVQQRNARPVVWFVIAAIVGFVVSAGYHMSVMWHLFRNPFFPLFNDIFKSPFYDPVALVDDRFLPRNFLQYLAYPFYWAIDGGGLTVELSFRDPRGALTYLSVAVVLIATLLRIRQWKSDQPGLTPLLAVCVFVAVSYIGWVCIFGIYRYFICIEMLSGIVVVGTLARVLTNSAPKQLFASVAVAALALGATKFFPLERYTTAYGQKYIEVEVPSLPKNSVVVALGGEPVSYIVPFAEPSIRFVSIDNNMLKIDQNSGLTKILRSVLADQDAKKFLLKSPGAPPPQVEQDLKYLDLKLTGGNCLPIKTNFDERNLQLCPVAP